MAKFTVAIIGAGMSGLIFALALHKLSPDIEFHVYEGAHELSEVGAGIAMQQRAWSIMQSIGLDGVLMHATGTDDRGSVTLTYRKADQKEGVEFSVEQLDAAFTFHRAELQKILIQELERTGHSVRVGKRLTSYIQARAGTDAPIELHFQDGTTAECDLLVGADGIRSAVRRIMYSQFADAALKGGNDEAAKALRGHIKPVFSGTVIYRFIIRKSELTEDDTNQLALNHSGMTFYCGKNKNLVTYPISQGRTINCAAVVSVPGLGQEGAPYEGPWATPMGREEVIQYYSGWESDVQDIMKHVDGGLKWTVGVVTRLPTYVDGRVALIGDAAHAMTPYQGVGAGQGFEDAYILARLLARLDTDRSALPAVLRAYDEVRRPFSQNVAKRSYTTGKTVHFDTPPFVDLTEEQSATGSALSHEQLQQVGVAIAQAADWRNASTIEEETEAAFRKLDESLLSARLRPLVEA